MLTAGRASIREKKDIHQRLWSDAFFPFTTHPGGLAMIRMPGTIFHSLTAERLIKIRATLDAMAWRQSAHEKQCTDVQYKHLITSKTDSTAKPHWSQFHADSAAVDLDDIESADDEEVDVEFIFRPERQLGSRRGKQKPPVRRLAVGCAIAARSGIVEDLDSQRLPFNIYKIMELNKPQKQVKGHRYHTTHEVVDAPTFAKARWRPDTVINREATWVPYADIMETFEFNKNCTVPKKSRDIILHRTNVPNPESSDEDAPLAQFVSIMDPVDEEQGGEEARTQDKPEQEEESKEPDFKPDWLEIDMVVAYLHKPSEQEIADGHSQRFRLCKITSIGHDMVLGTYLHPRRSKPTTLDRMKRTVWKPWTGRNKEVEVPFNSILSSVILTRKNIADAESRQSVFEVLDTI